jgi:hypothetical protein
MGKVAFSDKLKGYSGEKLGIKQKATSYWWQGLTLRRCCGNLRSGIISHNQERRF